MGSGSLDAGAYRRLPGHGQPSRVSAGAAATGCLNGRVTDSTVAALVSLGLSEDEARAAVDENRIALAVAEKALAGERTLSGAEVAERSGVPLEVIQAWEAALGVPPQERYRESDVDDAKLLGQLIRQLPNASLDALLRPVRADGQALQRMAMAHLELIHRTYVQPMREHGGDEVAVALVLAEAARALMPTAAPLVGTAYRRILEHLLSSEIVAQATLGGGDSTDLAVAFVDVVGYTSLSARIDPQGLDEVIEAFETRCYTVAGLNERIQLVKFLGDAAMFVSVDPVTLAGAMLDLVDYADHDSPLAGSPMAAGMAFGNTLLRQGDYFGPPVNHAARLTDRARAGTLLAAPDLDDVLSPHYELRHLPPIHLRGLGHQRPLAVRRRHD